MCKVNTRDAICAYGKHLAALAAFCCGLAVRSQEVSLSYDSEWQTDFHDSANWVNLFTTKARINICHGLSAGIGTVSTCKTRQNGLISDLLTYSNIEEENIPLAFNRFGICYGREKWYVFVGVGNVNDAFFVTPVTSIFTNSSCGIFPTISCNFGIANFPDAAMGVESRYESGDISVCSALYNGKGYHRFGGRDCVFRIRPSSDGIFNINAVNYSRNGNNYNMGIGIYHGYADGYETFAQEPLPAEISEKRTAQIFYWLYAEQKITSNTYLIGQFSQCPAIECGCRNFYGVGVAYRARKYDVALYSCYAGFSDSHEWASELTFKYNLLPDISLQPSLHYIRNTTFRGAVGLLRIGFTFNP